MRPKPRCPQCPREMVALGVVFLMEGPFYVYACKSCGVEDRTHYAGPVVRSK